MGYTSFGNDKNDDFQMCFNGAKMFELEWYTDHVSSVTPSEISSTFNLIGVDDYERSLNHHTLILQILNTEQKDLLLADTENKPPHQDLFLTYNKKKGINKDNKKAVNKVTVVVSGPVRKTDGKGNQSYLIAAITPNTNPHIIPNFMEGKDLIITVGAEASYDSINSVPVTVKLVGVTNINALILSHMVCPYSTEQQENFSHLGAGCDGQDNDCDSVTFGLQPLLSSRVDECDEDKAPPTIILKNEPPSFRSKHKAEEWFQNNAEISDDCAINLKITFTWKRIINTPSMWSMTMLVFDERCYRTKIEYGFVNGVNKIVDGPGESSTEKDIIVNVDGVAPAVECGFHDLHWKNIVEDGTLYHYDGNHGLHASNFYYEIMENCPDAVQVQVIVKSNQFEYNSVMGRLKSFKTHGYNQQTKFYYAADGCRYSGPECEADDSIELNVKFYEVDVIATDAAGNVGMETCKIIIVPPCKKGDDGCETEDKTYNNNYRRDYLLNVVNRSILRYDILSTITEWKKDLLTLSDKTHAPTRAPKSKSAKGSKSPKSSKAI